MATLTISQLQYIDTIHQLGQPTITEVAGQLGFSKASATAGINKLVQKGFVTKTQSERDKRSWYVFLPAAGERLVDAKYQALQTHGQMLRYTILGPRLAISPPDSSVCPVFWQRRFPWRR